ncbi:MAG: rod shape-determining protein MreD [Ruminococcus sp.]|nr:rod shape-determining protein MreD [Ruminococcus sp.]MDE6678554.1 rod shape-determining protein MreD [Ruminococcus sp.]
MIIKPSREKRILYIKTALRWLFYYVLIYAEFIFMTSGTLLKPIILIPTALYIAVRNDISASAVTGAICGFLIDVSCGKLFGYNAVLLTVSCIIVSLIFEFYLRDKFVSFIFISAVVSYIQCWLDYKFYYEIWNYENHEMIFTDYTLKIWAYTVISSVFVCLLLRLINHFLMPKTHFTIEETIKAEQH